MATYPPKFGPHLWRIIHLQAKRLDGMCAHDYKQLTKGEEILTFQNQRKVLYEFLHNLDAHIPCGGCSINFLSFRDEHPVPSPELQKDQEPLENTFFHWSVDLHNHANAITGKRNVSYDEAQKMFEKEWLDEGEEIEISKAQRMRLEDHFKIKELEEELKAARDGESDLTSPVNIALLVSLMVVTVIAIVIIAILLKRRS